MSPFVETVVAMAAIVYLLGRAKVAASALEDAIIKHSLQGLDKLHKETRAEIRPAFELWWEKDQKQRAINALREKLQDHAAELSDEQLESTMALPLDELKSDAWHVAVHAYMGTREASLIAKLPNIGNTRERAMASNKAHQQGIDTASTTLVDFGVDLAELYAHFSPAH